MILKVVGGVLAAVGVGAGALIGRFAYRNLDSFGRYARDVEQIGFVEKQAVVNGVTFNYAESPPNGPALLIIPGQGSDWKSFGNVLPELAAEFHVFAVDVHGHGGTDHTPDRYTAVQVGADLRQFLIEIVGKPAIVSGHSSGGQLAAWLGANAPDQVSAVLLEDPPMLTTLLPRAQKTWNWVDLASSCHAFLTEYPTYPAEGDVPSYLWEHQYMWKYFGNSARRMQRAGVKRRLTNPDEPIKIWWWPGYDYQRSLTTYDPRFGDAFYTGAWDEGFDHEATLRAIEQPTIYLHAKADYDGEILRGAADDEDAKRIMELLPNAQYVQTGTGHGVHNEAPKLFVSALLRLKERI
jgi:pimeloyl-ACP methyl ester carboxylesterase